MQSDRASATIPYDNPLRPGVMLAGASPNVDGVLTSAGVLVSKDGRKFMTAALHGSKHIATKDATAALQRVVDMSSPRKARRLYAFSSDCKREQDCVRKE